jgi:hypothetical protein
MLSYFSYFSYSVDKIRQERSNNNLLTNCKFQGNGRNKSHALFRAPTNFNPYFPRVFLILVKVNIRARDMHIIWFSMCEFHESRRRHNRTILVCVNESTFTPCESWEVKEALVKSVYHVTEFVMFNLALYSTEKKLRLQHQKMGKNWTLFGLT